MGLFSKSTSKPSFTSFSEQHFKIGVQRILWHGEQVFADGFFEDGPDPMGEEDELKGIFGGNSHTYLAATNWRIILGYLANGNFVSYEFKTTEPQVRRSGSKFYFTYSNPDLKTSGHSTFRSTYSISKELTEAIELNIVGERPSKKEETKIHLSRKSWGEGPMAELAKTYSGREYMLVEVCTACTATSLAPDDIETSPEKGISECRTCLRVKVNS
ncbi:unannotated protein [freshwater metagenome]|uniref:Unannotated protein n=1 Tax=freshwater metagenome TaxID=449393 RepID=A0A6J6U9W4_9ZZZZ|nr:hypothetical protein [Actinomycetota bacterium]